MGQYFYPTDSISGVSVCATPVRFDEVGNGIFINNYLKTIIPYKECSVSYVDSGVYIEYDNDLGGAEKIMVDEAISKYLTWKISPLENIFHNWKSLYPDFGSARSDFSSMVQLSGIANLNPIEFKMAAKWFILNKTLRDSVVPAAQQLLDERSIPSSMTIFNNDVLLSNVKLWANIVYTNSSGQAIFIPTYDKTITGAPIFSMIGGCNATAISGVDNVLSIPFASLKQINFGNREVVINVVVAQNVELLDATPLKKAPGGVPVRCVIMGV